MINKIMSFLNPIIPIGLAAKGLEKINPKMKSFFSGALASGYTADQAISFLRDQFSSPGQKQLDSQQGSLRPDEQAAKSRMQHEEMPSKIAHGLGVAGAGLAGGLGAASLASSALGEDQTQQKSVNSDQSQSQSPVGFEELIRQNPELGSYLDELILKKGLSPQQAAMEAKKKRKFMPIIEGIEGKIGQSFEDLMAQLFQGFGQQQKPQSSQQDRTGLAELAATIKEYQALKSGRR